MSMKTDQGLPAESVFGCYATPKIRSRAACRCLDDGALSFSLTPFRFLWLAKGADESKPSASDEGTENVS